MCDCMDRQNGGWDESKLIDRFGEDTTRRIALTILGPVHNPMLHDKLMYTTSANRVFTLKRAYLTMLDSSKGGINCTPAMKEKWKLIWGLNEIPPKVRVFLWKAVKDALPTLAKLHTRMPYVQPTCPVCKLADETTTHALFYCTRANAVWFSSLGLRTDRLMGDMGDILAGISQNSDREFVIKVVTILWAVWKARCQCLYEERKHRPEDIIRSAAEFQLLVNMGMQMLTGHAVQEAHRGAVQIDHHGNNCWVDGSFSEPDNEGTGYVLYARDEVLCYEVSYSAAHSPFHMEALAMLRAVKGAIQ